MTQKLVLQLSELRKNLATLNRNYMRELLRCNVVKFALILIVVISSGCVRVPKLSIIGQPLSTSQIEALQGDLKNNWSQIRTLRALFDARIEGGGQSQKLRQVLLYAAPDKIRLESLPIGAAYAVNILIGADGRLTFVDTTAKRAFSGENSAEFMDRITNVPLTVSEFSGFILGFLPASVVSASESKVYRDLTSGEVSVVASGSQQVFIADANGKLLKAQFRPTLGPVGNVNFKYDLANQLSEVELTIPAEKVSLRLSLVKLELNSKLSDGLFRLSLPRDYVVSK